MSLSLITGSLQDLKCLCTAFVCIDSPYSCEFDVLNCFCIYLPLTVACDCVAPVLSFYFPHFLSFIFLFPYTEIGGGKRCQEKQKQLAHAISQLLASLRLCIDFICNFNSSEICFGLLQSNVHVWNIFFLTMRDINKSLQVGEGVQLSNKAKLC